MESNWRVRIGSHALSLLMHAMIITTTAVVFVAAPELIDIRRVEIGEQIQMPAQLSLSGTPDDNASDLTPPSGQEDPAEYSERFGAKIPKQIIQSPDKPLPSDEDKQTSAGLPGEPQPQSQPIEGVDGPAKSGKPGVDSEGIPKLFGVPLRGKTVFLVDVSGSMGSIHKYVSRLDAVKVELINTIGLMSLEDEFDIVAFSDFMPSERDYCMWLWNKLTPATKENKEIAIEWIKDLAPGGSTPTYEALRHVCRHYPQDLDNFLLLTDGQPNGLVEEILDEFPEWYEHFVLCKFVCVSIGDESKSFVMLLADSVKGMYSIIE